MTYCLYYVNANRTKYETSYFQNLRPNNPLIDPGPLIEIHKLIHKILSINKILTPSIKGYNSVKNGPKIMCIRDNMDLVYINVLYIQNFSKIHQFVLKILRKNTFLHQSRAITLLFINKFSPFAIQNHSYLISMSMQSLKKIGQKLFKLESGNKALTDGWINSLEGIT